MRLMEMLLSRMCPTRADGQESSVQSWCGDVINSWMCLTFLSLLPVSPVSGEVLALLSW